MPLSAPPIPITIVERKALTIMGLRMRTRAMSPDIPALWQRFDGRMRESSTRASPACATA